MKQELASAGVKPEMGSAILYGAINDMDLGEATIPDYKPPGMPDTGSHSQLYGTNLDPVSAWSIGAAQGSQPVSLNDQSITQLSAESYSRGSTKYLEEAETLLVDEDNEQKNNLEYQRQIVEKRLQAEEEEKDTEDVIG